MPVFDYRFTVNAPCEAVSAFHFRTGILKALTPPMMIMQVHRFDPLANGSIGEFTICMGPIPVRWVAEHSDVSLTGFVDTQISGPMKLWKHTHRFNRVSPQVTEVHEHIEFEHHSGLRGIWSRMLFPRIALIVLFTYRRWATRRAVR